MRTIIFLIAVFIASVVNAQQTETDITVTVNNIKKAEGHVRMALYTENNFLREPIIARASKIENGQAVVSFEKVPAGTYAVVAFHDENDNIQMDFEINGMPKENYGSSNNIMGFGPPQWSDARFEVTNEPIDLEIKF